MASPFRPAPTLLAQYAEYHRDRRNIATHFIGVPMIMFGSLVLLSRPGFELAGLALSPAWLLLVLVIAWTLSRGAPALGLVTSAVWLALAVLALPGGLLAWFLLDWAFRLPAWPLLISFVVTAVAGAIAAAVWIVRPLVHWVRPEREAQDDANGQSRAWPDGDERHGTRETNERAQPHG
jgi:hypothetical protein